MGLASSRGLRLNELGYGAIELGLEPPIEGAGRRAAPFDRRTVSMRWLCATVLV